MNDSDNEMSKEDQMKRLLETTQAAVHKPLIDRLIDIAREIGDESLALEIERDLGTKNQGEFKLTVPDKYTKSQGGHLPNNAQIIIRLIPSPKRPEKSPDLMVPDDLMLKELQDNIYGLLEMAVRYWQTLPQGVPQVLDVVTKIENATGKKLGPLHQLEDIPTALQMGEHEKYVMIEYYYIDQDEKPFKVTPP